MKAILVEQLKLSLWLLDDHNMTMTMWMNSFFWSCELCFWSCGSNTAWPGFSMEKMR